MRQSLRAAVKGLPLCQRLTLPPSSRASPQRTGLVGLDGAYVTAASYSDSTSKAAPVALAGERISYRKFSSTPLRALRALVPPPLSFVPPMSPGTPPSVKSDSGGSGRNAASGSASALHRAVGRPNAPRLSGQDSVGMHGRGANGTGGEYGLRRGRRWMAGEAMGRCSGVRGRAGLQSGTAGQWTGRSRLIEKGGIGRQSTGVRSG